MYVEGPLRAGARIALPERAAHHARAVLRLREGEQVILFDGAGGENDARIVSVARGRVEAEVAERRQVERESPLSVTLVQGVSSGERMDLTVQKAVELGVAAIQPVLAERSLVKLDAEARCGPRRALAQDRGRGLRAVRAQPGARGARRRFARRLLPRAAGRTRLLLSPGAGLGLRAAAARIESVVVLAAGPEAGFSAEEEAMLIGAGFEPVRLGPRVLRTETAALAALAALNALAGDY